MLHFFLNPEKKHTSQTIDLENAIKAQVYFFKNGIVGLVLRYFYTWKVCWKDKAITWVIESKKCFAGGQDPDR